MSRRITEGERELMLAIGTMMGLAGLEPEDSCAILATVLSTYAVSGGMERADFVAHCGQSFDIAVEELPTRGRLQ